MDNAMMPLLATFYQRLLGSGAGITPAIVRSWIASIDQILSRQLAEVLRHPDFRRLETTWRGLHYLVDQSQTGEDLKIRVLNVSKRELLRDSERAMEFDQSALFEKVHDQEYVQLGGQPYGLLIGDYEFGPHPEDISLLWKISDIAAAAHAPFVAAASPKLFNMEQFTELAAAHDLAKIFEGAGHAAWESFRESGNSRYVALTLPRVLARLPYGQHFKRVTEFNFEELEDGEVHDKFVWMNAAWVYAARVTAAFDKYGWFDRTSGTEGGGKAEGLPVHAFPTDDGSFTKKYSTEIVLPARREVELSKLGFLPLVYSKDCDFPVFMIARSCQKPKTYADSYTSFEAELATHFRYTLCACRFLSALVLQARGTIRTEKDLKDWEDRLNAWISYYAPTAMEASESVNASRPLNGARVRLRWKGPLGRGVEAVVYFTYRLTVGFHWGPGSRYCCDLVCLQYESDKPHSSVSPN
jgi:type VI secretion system protein ImpC